MGRWALPFSIPLSIAFPILCCFGSVCSVSTIGCAYSPLDTGFQVAASTPRKPETFVAPADSGMPDVTTSDDASVDAGLPDYGDTGPSPAGDSGGRADTAPPMTCSLSFPTQMPACDTCIGRSCCAEDNACGGDQACLAVVGCMDQCASSPDAGANPTACFDACAQQDPAGASVLAALEQCLEGQCQVECQ
jgi:hypothetical protein